MCFITLIYYIRTKSNTSDMKFNFLIVAITTFIPLALGSIWYHPKIFGNAWLSAASVSPDRKKPHMPVVFGLTIVFGFFIAFMMHVLVIHQLHVFSLVQNIPDANTPGSETYNMVHALIDKFGTNFRTFKHGALHGTLTGLFFVTPIMAINAMFEGHGFKYIAINGGYWILCLAIMGGLVCGFPA
jgi:hypothetical protein